MAVSLLEARRQILLNTPHIESASGSIATFNTDLSTNLTDMKIHFHPVQEGTGDPSPDNVRPITGWDGVTMIKTGKNLANLNESEMLSHSWTKAFPNPFRKPGRYTISCQNMIITGSQSGSFVFLGNAVTDSSGYGLTGWTFGKSVMSVSFNVNVGELEKKYIVFRFNAPPNYASLSNAQIQIEEGLEATEYENPPLEIPISFGRTIYGGYVDLIKGEVVEEWVRREMSAFSSIYGPSGSSEPWNHQFNVRNWTTGTGYDRKTGGDIRVYSDCVKSNGGLGRTNYTADDSTANWYIYDNTISTAAEFKEKYAGHYAVYRLLDSLATTYHLTPQQLKSLKGINNIWSNANGDVEVKFWKH